MSTSVAAFSIHALARLNTLDLSRMILSLHAEMSSSLRDETHMRSHVSSAMHTLMLRLIDAQLTCVGIKTEMVLLAWDELELKQKTGTHTDSVTDTSSTGTTTATSTRTTAWIPDISLLSTSPYVRLTTNMLDADHVSENDTDATT